MNDDIGIAMRTRHTVLDGEVRMFATAFREIVQEKRGIRYDAAGPFYVSASRNCITVHKCELRAKAEFDLFVLALTLANGAMDELRKGIIHGD